MPLLCARCQMPLPQWELTHPEGARCTSCWSLNTVSAFPAMFRAPAAPARPAVALDGEAACFDHPGKRAVSACNQCGRFVCDLCQVEFHGQIWCPSCVVAGSGAARAANPDSSRVLYDSIALAVPTLSLICFWPITTLTAPGTLVFSLVKWKQPLSLVRRSRWRFVVAMAISLAECIAWLWLLVYWVQRLMSGQ